MEREDYSFMLFIVVQMAPLLITNAINRENLSNLPEPNDTVEVYSD